LLHTAPGRTLLLRSLHKRLTKQQKKEATVPYNRMEELTKIAKDHGLEKFAKGLADDTGISGAISEHEFTAMVDGIAKQQGTTFVKLFTAQDDLGIALRKAHLAINQHPDRAHSYMKSFPTFQPTTSVATGGETGTRRGESGAGDVAEKAYAQLMALAEKMHQTKPALTVAQCFARVAAETANAELLADSVLRSRARNS
jgi:hypothetical protein